MIRARRPRADPIEVEKRASFEPPSRLAEKEVAPARVRRPAATTFGVVLVVLRVVAGIVWLVALAAEWDTVEAEVDVVLGDRPEAAVAESELPFVLVAVSVLLAVNLLLAVLVWFGSNGARITVMVIATGYITVAAIDSFTGDVEVTVRTTFLTVALDILILLALSSRESRAFARHTRGFARPHA